MSTTDGTTLKTKVIMFLDSKTPEEIENMNVRAVRKGVCAEYGIELTPREKTKLQEYIMEYFKKEADAVTKKEEAEAAAAALAAVSKPKKRKAGVEPASAAAEVVATLDVSAGNVAGAVTIDAAAVAEPAKKKVKQKPSEPTCWVRTPGGAEAPKFLKRLQDSAMKTSTFLKNAGDLEIELFGNTVGGVPRIFSSGNKGWYCGGKILIKVGRKKLWAQCGLNITILGSKEWKK